jgi:hypothetical protein
MQFAKTILAFAASLLFTSALGDSLSETRCWCANEDYIGLVYTVNFTSTKYDRDYNYWVRYSSRRQDETYKNTLGVRCDNGTCHNIPKVETTNLIANAMTVNRDYGRCETFEDGRTVCMTPGTLWTDDETWHWYVEDKEYSRETVTDCATLCKKTWSQDEKAYDLCTYESRQKGELYGKMIPSGEKMDKKGRLSNRKDGMNSLWVYVSCDYHHISDLRRRGFIDG